MKVMRTKIIFSLFILILIFLHLFYFCINLFSENWFCWWAVFAPIAIPLMLGFGNLKRKRKETKLRKEERNIWFLFLISYFISYFLRISSFSSFYFHFQVGGLYNNNLGGVFPVMILVVIIGVCLSVAVYFTTQPHHPPKYKGVCQFFSFLFFPFFLFCWDLWILFIYFHFSFVFKALVAAAFLMSIVWIYMIASELVALLTVRRWKLNFKRVIKIIISYLTFLFFVKYTGIREHLGCASWHYGLDSFGMGQFCWWHGVQCGGC